MRVLIPYRFAAFFAAAAAFGQTGAPTKGVALQFEVASIKPSGPLDTAAIVAGKAHIGTKVDNARVDIGSASLLQLICQAYKVKPYEVTGMPDWAATTRFDIMAKLPDGASADQVPEMLQSLLADRFKLAVHHDKKDQSVYALIEGKGGPKLKEVPPDPPPPTAAPGSAQSPAAPAKGEIVIGSGDQQVRLQRSGGGMTMSTKDTGPVHVSMDNGNIRMDFEKMTMDMLASTLSQYLDHPVVNQTELKGAYQVSLQLAMADAMNMAGKLGMPVGMAGPPPGARNGLPGEGVPDPSGSSLFASVQQLGLKLENRKLPYDYLVVDHLEKTPTEN